MKQVFGVLFLVSISFPFLSCTENRPMKKSFTGEKGEVRLMTLHPGHFHAALVQKTMYEQIAPEVHVYAPPGQDVDDHVKRIQGFNSREENPTHWQVKLYTGEDFLERMLREKPGNVLITAGNNQRKTAYIKAAVDAGIHVLADKPMCIDESGFRMLKEAFASAEQNGILLYDIMTERSEITTILQKELSLIPEIFGELEKGTPDNPAVVKESVHHFFKTVAGSPLKRPAWFFDVTQEGDGLVDVTTHLVDLVQWACFPQQIIDYEREIEILSAKRWPNYLTLPQFSRVTQQSEFPDYLSDLVKGEVLPVYCNGEILYRIKGVVAKVAVVWNYEAPEGAKDTHYSVMRGSKANLIILQGKEQNYRPELYVEAIDPELKASLDEALKHAIRDLQKQYPGIALQREQGRWHVTIPDDLRIGHEAHFAQVTERFLDCLFDGKLPDWEVPNMIAKYYITTTALKLAKSCGER